VTHGVVTDVDEPVDEFRLRVRNWLAANMPRIDPAEAPITRLDLDESWQRARALQRRLYDGGFAGICFPREYGGLGMTIDHQKAFNTESGGYEMPLILNIPSLTICCATLLDVGGEEQKRQHISAALRGEEVLAQLLSEPGGGSDLAGLTTRGDRRGDTWVMNGAKTWSTSAFAADYGLCLVRTDWEVPKHEGLTMFLVPIDHPGVTLRRIKMINGSSEFCEEFFDDVELPDDAVVGGVGNGWKVASRQLYHERRSMGRSSEFASGLESDDAEAAPVDYLELATRTGQCDDDWVKQASGRALTHRAVAGHLADHVYRGVRDGTMPDAAGSIIRLFYAEAQQLEIDTAQAIAGSAAVIGDEAGLFAVGANYLERQIVSLGGGTTEIARNVIAERVLEMPREYAADRGVPFGQVPRGRGSVGS
jgi:alkylation response protein AidB-like acyl-CoA dehydrogenase